jgi:N-acetyl-anhydromuramyl-L-alanine amidase AmpD
VSRLAELLARATVREKGPWDALREGRVGVMLHYTAGTDLSGLQWLLFDARCRVSYNWLVLDDGTTVSVAPQDARAWHAGRCEPSPGAFSYQDANSAFYGLAIAAESADRATDAQMRMVVSITSGLFRGHRWPASSVVHRVRDHASEAWPRGRKVDTGAVLPLDRVQRAVMAELRAAA